MSLATREEIIATLLDSCPREHHVYEEIIATLLDSCPREHHVYFRGKALWVEWELPGGFTLGARATMVDPTKFELEKGLTIAKEKAIEVIELRLGTGKAIMKQFSMLPLDLIFEWIVIRPMEIDWFIKASEFIDIPYSLNIRKCDSKRLRSDRAYD